MTVLRMVVVTAAVAAVVVYLERKWSGNQVAKQSHAIPESEGRWESEGGATPTGAHISSADPPRL
jgi:hypothetical protein